MSKGPIKLVWKLSCGLARVQFTQFVKQLDLDVLGSVLITHLSNLLSNLLSLGPLKKKLGRGRTTWRCWEGCGRIRSHEDTEIHLEQGWRQVLWMEEDLPRFGWTSGTWWRRFVGRGTDHANFHEDWRTGLWFPTAFGFSFVSFPFKLLAGFW